MVTSVQNHIEIVSFELHRYKTSYYWHVLNYDDIKYRIFWRVLNSENTKPFAVDGAFRYRNHVGGFKDSHE